MQQSCSAIVSQLGWTEEEVEFTGFLAYVMYFYCITLYGQI